MQTNAPSCVCVCVKRICERRTLSGNPALLEGVKSWAATTFACAAIIHPLKGISMRQRRWMAGSFREWHKIGKTQGGSEGADPGWHRGHMEKDESRRVFAFRLKTARTYFLLLNLF